MTLTGMIAIVRAGEMIGRRDLGKAVVDGIDFGFEPVGSGLSALPLTEERPELAEHESLTEPRTVIGDDGVRIVYGKVRRLSGPVAILNTGWGARPEVFMVRDLGPQPVEVKSYVVPLIEERAPLADGEMHGDPVDEIADGRVTRRYPAVPVPALPADPVQEQFAALAAEIAALRASNASLQADVAALKGTKEAVAV